MKLEEAKEQFISNWGAFGSHWGVNRTMAQIHALLLVSATPLSQDDVMEQLSISRGNVNMNIRDLVNWGLARRVIIAGERKEFFVAEKDIWKVATIIMKERKKLELDPMLQLMNTLQNVEGDRKDPDTKEFIDLLTSLQRVGQKADKMFNIVINSQENAFTSAILKLLK